MIIYFLVFLLSFIFSFILTPLVRRLAFKINAIDIPKDERRIHKEPIPRIGGLAILISFSACIFIFSLFQKQVIGILVGAFVIFLGGFLDDLYSLTPKQKILLQIIAALILIAFDVTIKYITIPFDLNESLYIGKFGIFLTIIWVVGVTNAMNLIDGLDGLATGICFISSMFLFFISIISKKYTAMFLTLILAGASFGFLPYNFNPASIFLGDCGAQLLGFLLSAISIQGAIKSVAFVIVVPILILAIPIYDTLFAIIRRKINKRPISQADRGHFHHRLLDMGFSQKQAVLIMYFISFIFGIASVFVMILTPRKSLAVFLIIFSVSLAFAIEFGLLSKK